MVKAVLKWLFVLFVLLIIVGTLGAEFFIEIPLKLAFGWIWFTRDNLEAMQPNWLLIAEGVACVAALGFGGHYFMRWLWAQMAPAESPRWRAQWTVAGLGALLLLFVAGIATIGITHQAAWLFTDKRPLLVDPFTDRFRVTEAIVSGTEARTAVTEFFQKTGRLPDSAAEAGFKTSAPASRYAKSVGVGSKGVVSVEIVEGIAGGGTISLTPTANGTELQWKCSGTLPRRHLPGSCREP